ncbi:MAG: tetratricopeptide repeat protein [Rivularia sp. (in: cyanobacteria)]
MQQSVADYTKVISLEPNFALAYYKRCASYEFQNNFDKAILDCKKAISLDPKLSEAYNILRQIDRPKHWSICISFLIPFLCVLSAISVKGSQYNFFLGVKNLMGARHW